MEAPLQMHTHHIQLTSGQVGDTLILADPGRVGFLVSVLKMETPFDNF